MEGHLQLADNKKWKAVVNCDKNYDGLFFYGVKTTGIFCRPSCRAKTPIRKNVLYFDDSAHAIASGFRPCKRCRPDKIIFQPDLELSRRAKAIIDEDYTETINLYHISRQLGVSTNHLIRVFKQSVGLTPAQYMINLRVNKSLELLRKETFNIIDIAYMSGFRSVSNFYKCFKDQVGKTPKEYRKA